MFARYRLRCDRSFLVRPRSLTGLHDVGDAAVGFPHYLTGHFSALPLQATAVANGTAIAGPVGPGDQPAD
jgi:hypothetical protein